MTSSPSGFIVLRLCCLLPVVLGIGSFAAGQSDTATPKIGRDLSKVDPGPAPQLPAAGGTFVDPVYGATLLRITDEKDGQRNHTAYSYWPSFNRDATRLHISSSGTPTLYDFDAENLRIRKVGPLFAKPTPAGGPPRWEDAIWSATEPNVLFAHDLRRLWAYDVAKREYTLLKDFAGRIGQMSRSVDDNVFAFTARDDAGGESGVVWQREGDEITRHAAQGLDEVQIDKTGRYLQVKLGAQGAGVLSVQVLDLQGGKVEDLMDDQPDYAPGHSDNGRDLVVGHDNFRNHMTARRLSDPHRHITVLDLQRNWNLGVHVSLLADDERWCMLSFYGDQASDGPFRNEIVQVATDGSGKVRRLVNHRTVFGGVYWQIPLANISRDGRFVAFTSNYDGKGQTDVFVLRVPPMTEEDQYPVDTHPLIGRPAAE